MTLQEYTKKWGLSAGRWRNVTVAVIFLLALSMWSCAGRKAISREIQRHETDSVRERITLTTELVKVPQSLVSLPLAPTDVMGLKTGQMYREQSGQASVTVEYRDSLIYITATCDSLQLVVESQNRELYHLRQTLKEREEQVSIKPGFWERIKNAVFFFALGCVFMYFVPLIKKFL